MTDINPPAPNPCQSCPYRQDAPSGVWSAEDYVKLVMYDRPTFAQPTNLFQCHQNDRHSDRARVCAGWVACHGQELLALRIAVSAGRLPPTVMDYQTPVAVFESGKAAAAHGLRRIPNPGAKARALIEKISQTRTDLHS